MCRVWYDNRPPGQRSPPTSCADTRATAARDGGLPETLAGLHYLAFASLMLATAVKPVGSA